MSQNVTAKEAMRAYPCFSAVTHRESGRINLPVAPACNIQCRYCHREFDRMHERGVGSEVRVLGPEEAVELAGSCIEKQEDMVAVISGPGEPLANAAAYVVLRSLNRNYSDLTLCVSTNGLLLPDRLEELVQAGVRCIAVAINALTPGTAEKLYSRILYRGRRYSGRETMQFFLAQQWRGLALAVEAGLTAVVNSLLIPGVNEDELPLIAQRAGELGAEGMNLLPLIPKAEFAHLSSPSDELLNKKRRESAPYISPL